MPIESVIALGFLIEGDQEGWSIDGWQEHARRILEIGLSKGAQAREEALRVVNLLGSGGAQGYRDLVKKS